MRSVPAADFYKQYKSIKKEIDSAIDRVFKSGWYVLGKEVENFESELSKFLKIKYVVGVASGTDALTLAIKSLELGSSDEVVIPANSYPTSFGVSLSGVKIALADVDPKTLNVTVETLKKTVTKNTKAIVVVHMYGNPAEISKIKNFAKKNKLFLIEDCAQAIGAEYRGKIVGGFGDIACFSFYPTKNLGAVGDAGAIATNNKKLFEKVKLFRNYGEQNKYDSVLIGHNSRLDELQAAILSVKLKHLKAWTEKRRKLAKLYVKLLQNLPMEIIQETNEAKSVFHLFVVRTKRREELREYLKSKGISALVHYPVSVSETKSFKNLIKQKFPISEISSKEVLSIPIFAEMEEEDVLYVATHVKNFFNKSQ